MTKTETAKRLLRRIFIKTNNTEYYTIDGKRDGEYKTWHYNGQPSEYCHYRNGRLDGEDRSWHDNGQLHRRCYYKNGKLDGEYKSWRDNGQLIMYCHYKNGIKIK